MICNSINSNFNSSFSQQVDGSCENQHYLLHYFLPSQVKESPLLNADQNAIPTDGFCENSDFIPFRVEEFAHNFFNTTQQYISEGLNTLSDYSASAKDLGSQYVQQLQEKGSEWMNEVSNFNSSSFIDTSKQVFSDGLNTLSDYSASAKDLGSQYFQQLHEKGSEWMNEVSNIDYSSFVNNVTNYFEENPNLAPLAAFSTTAIITILAYKKFKSSKPTVSPNATPQKEIPVVENSTTDSSKIYLENNSTKTDNSSNFITSLHIVSDTLIDIETIEKILSVWKKHCESRDKNCLNLILEGEVLIPHSFLKPIEIFNHDSSLFAERKNLVELVLRNFCYHTPIILNAEDISVL